MLLLSDKKIFVRLGGNHQEFSPGAVIGNNIQKMPDVFYEDGEMEMEIIKRGHWPLKTK